MSCFRHLSEEYIQYLFSLKSLMLAADVGEHDAIWLREYESVRGRLSELGTLPRAFALIHPDFYYRKSISFKDSIPSYGPRAFPAKISDYDDCQAHIYTQVPCAFNSNRILRGRVQADHRFPSSLGGPTIMTNRLLLCSYHNQMKSNDISHLDWSDTPSWLIQHLDNIRALKQ